jgi:hypothetical protein
MVGVVTRVEYERACIHIYSVCGGVCCVSRKHTSLPHPLMRGKAGDFPDCDAT